MAVTGKWFGSLAVREPVAVKLKFVRMRFSLPLNLDVKLELKS